MDEVPLVYEQQYHQAQVSVQDIDAPMGNDKGYGDDMGLNHGSYAMQDMGSNNNKTGDDATTVLGKRGPRPFSYVELLLKMGFKRREVDNYNFDQGELFDLPKLCALSLQMDIPVFKSFALGYGSMQVYLNRRFGFELNKHEANGYRSFKANRIFSSFVQKFEDLWLTEYEKLKVEREMRAQSLMSLRLLSLNYQTSTLVLSSCYKFTSLWTKQHDISSRLAPNHEESQFQVTHKTCALTGSAMPKPVKIMLNHSIHHLLITLLIALARSTVQLTAKIYIKMLLLRRYLLTL